jgi:hypothetical protein
MNQFARNNPELAAQGQFHAGGSPSQNPADHADYCECDLHVCKCSHDRHEHDDYEGACEHASCGCKEFRS